MVVYSVNTADDDDMLLCLDFVDDDISRKTRVFKHRANPFDDN